MLLILAVASLSNREPSGEGEEEGEGVAEELKSKKVCPRTSLRKYPFIFPLIGLVLFTVLFIQKRQLRGTKIDIDLGLSTFSNARRSELSTEHLASSRGCQVARLFHEPHFLQSLAGCLHLSSVLQQLPLTALAQTVSVHFSHLSSHSGTAASNSTSSDCVGTFFTSLFPFWNSCL